MNRGQLGGERTVQNQQWSLGLETDQTACQSTQPCSSVCLLGFYEVSSKLPSLLRKTTFQKSRSKSGERLGLVSGAFCGICCC